MSADAIDDDIRPLQDYIEVCTNWGRWGPHDQVGALNPVGPEQVRAAAVLVTTSRLISLTLPYDQRGPGPAY